MTRWQRTPAELRRVVIATLEHDAEAFEACPPTWRDGDEHDRARALRAAIAVLRAAARGER